MDDENSRIEVVARRKAGFRNVKLACNIKLTRRLEDSPPVENRSPSRGKITCASHVRLSDFLACRPETNNVP
jgi:hypothetical protein